ncbi:YhjD/YihY/BrkB family envelope integrity protein [Rhodococcus erythropolis]|uniref:YihY/virulence factor BrkB family protein n=1 Tax=Rhodococcus erythropolis TaxID=1833 RepID=UPI00294A2A41|nr:YhjD/YihY/BrkB family envelope integrity protein [Rhodococcus erythropolis]MDV6277653.1 YhjD/YihY/BrkB family envelope integrity protein [Rhodococcus erythropolis]
MTIAKRLDALQQKHPALGFPIAVLYKFLDDQGVYLAALIAYYGFVSLFPLLLLLSTILGFVLSDNLELQQQILDSALHQFPVIGDDLGNAQQIGGGVTGLVIGIVGGLYGGLGVALACQNAMNTVWSVPRNMRPDPIRGRLQGLLLLGTIGLAILGTTAVSSIGGALHLGGSFGFLLTLAAVVMNAGIFIVAFRLTCARPLSVADVAPGAIAAAVLWQALQSFGALYVTSVVRGASTTNGVFAIVLGLLAFLFLAAASIVMCAEINVVRVDKLHPRALLAPFTDNTELIEGDRRTFADQAKAQRAVPHENIHVTFDRHTKSDESD